MRVLTESQIRDIIGWDVESWGKFLDFIAETELPIEGKKVLEVGAGNGGMSLYYVLQGADVTCTDYVWRDQIFENHKRNHVDDQIAYRQVGINDLSQYYENTFDYIVCKAVLGGIGRFNNGSLPEGIHEVYKCLKDGGYFIFADSVRATPLHAAARKLFGSNWHYFTREEIMDLCHEFTLVKEQYYGFLAPFTRVLKKHDGIRKFFGKVDSLIFEKIIPGDHRYIGAFLFRKGPVRSTSDTD